MSRFVRVLVFGLGERTRLGCSRVRPAPGQNGVVRQQNILRPFADML